MNWTCTQARALLTLEFETVREQAGEVALPLYDTLWNECVKDVCFVPSQVWHPSPSIKQAASMFLHSRCMQHRYGRAAVLSQKERVESLERELQVCPCVTWLSARAYLTHVPVLCAVLHGAACERWVQARSKAGEEGRPVDQGLPSMWCNGRRGVDFA